MPQSRDDYWTLIEVERQLRNALSIARDAEHLLVGPGPMRTNVSAIVDDLADAVALAGASKRRMLEERVESEARPAA